MKRLTFLLTAVLMMSLSSISHAQTCNDGAQTIQGVDILPWSLAKQFPWDNIQGYWKLGDDDSTYIKARVMSSTGNRKFLSLAVFGEGVCSRPYAKGTGYVDITEKNVVRAIIFDNQYRYQLKLGMFSSRDIEQEIGAQCKDRVMVASMQVIGRSNKIVDPDYRDVKPEQTEDRIMLLKKMTSDDWVDCGKSHPSK